MLNYQGNSTRMKFLVRGKKGHWHKITFEQIGDQLMGYCACPAGGRGEYCNHRYRLMKGSTGYLLSDNKDDVEKLMGLIKGTEIEDAMAALKAAEKVHKLAKANLKAARVHLGETIGPPANMNRRKAG